MISSQLLAIATTPIPCANFMSTSPTLFCLSPAAKPTSATTLTSPHSALNFAKATLQAASTSLSAAVSTQQALSKPPTVAAGTLPTAMTLASASQSIFQTLSVFLPKFAEVLC